MKLTFTLAPAPHPARQNAAKAVMEAPEGFVVTIQEPTRNLIQNSRLWASLSEVSRQVDWHGNKLTPEEWKDVFSAALKRQKVVPGIDGGFVVIGARTSKMGKREFSDLLGAIPPHGRAIFLEVKRPGRKPTAAQRAFLEARRAEGAVAFWADSVDSALRQFREQVAA